MSEWIPNPHRDDPPTPLPYAFIQWKGTDVCLDFYCVCDGKDSGHFDGYFAHFLRCKCGRVYQLPSLLKLVEATETALNEGPPPLDVVWDDE